MTSIAQRQSDALKAAAKVYRDPGKLVLILDDFLLVCPRRDDETDALVLDRGKRMCKKFHYFMSTINLPKAPEKDQDANFSTV